MVANYESLTMAASCADPVLPAKHEEDQLVLLPDGDYTCRIIQMFDPEVFDAADGDNLDFVLEILRTSSSPAPWASVSWFDDGQGEFKQE